jgi:hypothetical protein
MGKIARPLCVNLFLFLVWIKRTSALPFGLGRRIGPSSKDCILQKSITQIQPKDDCPTSDAGSTINITCCTLLVM